MSKDVRVRSYTKGDGERVRGYTRTTGGGRMGREELPPEKPHEADVEVHVAGHESHSKTGRPEKVKAYDEKRREMRFNGKSRQLYRKVYREYRKKGYSKEEADRIAGDVVGDRYREKLKRSGENGG